MTHEGIDYTKKFDYPTEDRWGLTPEEQVMLFGDQGVMDTYSPDAWRVLHAKAKLAREYLAYYWPETDIPKSWRRIRNHADKDRRKVIKEFRDDNPEFASEPIPLYPSPIAMAILHDADTDGWFEHNPAFRGAYQRAVEYARVATLAHLDDKAALSRLEYVVKVVDEDSEFGRRGDMRSGGGAWVEFPDAPWKCDLTEFPMHTIDPDKLF